jgi:hypothetical protein
LEINMSMETPDRAFRPFGADADVAAIVEAFQTRTLPAAAWTHQAHLAVGLWHVRMLGETGAMDRLRDAIRAYNTASGIPNSDTRGYHETVTRYFVWAAARFLETAPKAGLAALVDMFLAHPLATKSGVFRFWSRPRLLSVEARRCWVEPDLAPLACPDAAANAPAVDARPAAT